MNITIVWSMWHDEPDLVQRIVERGKEPVTEASIETPECFSMLDIDLLEELFEQTNLYEGPFWDRIEAVMPENRSHTALSTGDFVVIDGRSYRCESIGWQRAERPAATSSTVGR